MTTTPAHALFVDIEAKEIPQPDGRTELVFWFGWAAYWRADEADRSRHIQWQRIEDTETFWTWVEGLARQKAPLYIFAHNVYVDFSWLRGYTTLIERGWTPAPPYIQQWTTIAPWRKGNRKIVLLDTGNFFHMTLEALGDGLSLEKMGTKGRPYEGVSWDDYCKRDVEILYKAIMELFAFIREHDLGGFARTAASQAMRAYRHRFMPERIWIHNNRDMIELERLAYHGGRVETWYQGILQDGPYYKLDFNSAYPAAMFKYGFPAGDYRFVEHGSVDLLLKYIKSHCVIARVMVETDEPVYPFRKDHRLVFPVGVFETYLTTRELAYALDHDHIVRVYQTAVYYKERLFKDYVKFFYELRASYRKAGNRSFDTMCKLFLNGLSGKWGQRGFERRVVGTCGEDEVKIVDVIDVETKEVYMEVYYGGKIYREIRQGESYNSFTAIVAHITADARMALWEAVCDAGSDNVFYIDTDSLWTNRDGYKTLERALDDNRLGALKLEDTADGVVIYAPKDYEFGDTVKHKGVRQDAKEIAPGVFETVQWQGWRGALRKKEFGRVFTTPIIKRLHRTVTKGKLRSDGSIVPFRMQGDQTEAQVAMEWERYELETKLEGLRDSRRIPHKIVFTVWDYKEGDLRPGVDGPADGLGYKGIGLDVIAQELGFDDYSLFLVEVERQVSTDTKIKTLERLLKSLKEERR